MKDTMADGFKTSSCEVLPCESAAKALRRRHIEIRRIRIRANSGDAALLKRSRIQFDPSSNKKPKEKQTEEKQDSKKQPTLLQVSEQVEQQKKKQQDDHEEDDDIRLPSMVSSSSSSSEDLLSGTDLPCAATRDKSCPPFGTVSVCGRRREMEDAVAVKPDFITLPCTAGGCTVCSGESTSLSSCHFFGVYDGHGGSQQAATFCQDHLHDVLAGEMKDICSKDGCSTDLTKLWEDAMTNSFLTVDEQVRRPACSGDDCRLCNGNGCDEVRIPDHVGSTAIVAVVGCNQIVVANCGDCRAVLSRGGKSIPLSSDHKPNRPDETARVEAAGGTVINWDIPRVLGILAMSRSIGDQFMTPFLIADPEVKCIPRQDSDECLILASDGLWDNVSNDQACEIARRCISGRRKNQSQSQQHKNGTTIQEHESPCSAAASMLLKFAIHNGSKDNISVVVVDLKRPTCD